MAIELCTLWNFNCQSFLFHRFIRFVEKQRLGAKNPKTLLNIQIASKLKTHAIQFLVHTHKNTPLFFMSFTSIARVTTRGIRVLFPGGAIFYHNIVGRTADTAEGSCIVLSMTNSGFLNGKNKFECWASAVSLLSVFLVTVRELFLIYEFMKNICLKT